MLNKYSVTTSNYIHFIVILLLEVTVKRRYRFWQEGADSDGIQNLPGVDYFIYLFIYLFGVLCRFQHCTGHITTGSWKGRGI